MIELNMEQHFIIEIPLGEDSPMLYCFDYRAGFAAFRDVDLLGSTSFSTSIHALPLENMLFQNYTGVLVSDICYGYNGSWSLKMGCG